MSYFYLYDKFAQERRYEKDLARIEQRLTDIGIQGKVGRLALFRHAGELVQDEVRRGAKTVVVVGNDHTFHELMAILPELDVVTAFIPIGEPNLIATALGVSYGALACDILSARLVETLDVGKVNKQYFLSSVNVFHQDVSVDCDGQFRIRSVGGGGVEVRNLGNLGYKNLAEGIANPRDGLLDVLIFSELPKDNIFTRSRVTQSVFPMKKCLVAGPKIINCQIDGVARQFEQKLDFSIVPKALKVVVGKGRLI